MLREGESYWRLGRAERASLLIDGAAYFAALRAAIERARHGILILGWDIRADLLLDPEHSDETLRDLLDRVVATRPGLEVRILVWDWPVIYVLDRQAMPWWHLGLRTHDRIHFALDSCHPPVGSHHEKVVAIDGRLAFVGGIDLSAGRWDTPAHLPVEPYRSPVSGDNRPPCHDLCMMVEGPVAAAVEELALERWRRATGETVAASRPEGADDTLWPPAVSPDLVDTAVAIARTRPAWRGDPGAREIEALLLAAIGEARAAIYIENQYLTTDRVARALAARLREPAGPEVVIVTPKACEGPFETAVMDVGRVRLMRRLRRAAATPDRFRIMTVEVEAGGTTACVNVHAKLLIVDDRLLCVGSANLANRSMGLDTECNLAVEAADSRTAQAIRAIRARLLAEHLEAEPAEVERRLERHGGRAVPVIRAIGPGRLRDLRLRLSPLVRELASPARLIDLDEPLSSRKIAQHLAPPPRRRRLRDLFSRIGVVLAAVLAVGFLLGTGLLVGRDWVDWGMRLAAEHAASPLGAAAVVASFVLGSQLLVPVTLMIALTAAATGPWLGFAYAMAGACAAASVTFGIGRLLGRRRVRRMAGRRLAAVSSRLGQHGVIATSLIRLVPIAPFSVVNLAAGVSEISLRDFVLGSAIGLLPGILLTTIFGDRLGRWLRHPDLGNLLVLLAGLLLLLLVAHLLHRWSMRPAAA
ncbi:MAG TPA: VTT domain-containing protein [Geminicoccaceae bacterium]|nr:VTT domain-containing protein [Geminicoccus sp.]HMU53146.1 VTT domain-containing protein [Geminicoccaceae bacterium]